MPGIAAVLDAPLRVDPAHGDGGALCGSASLGPVRRRLLGGLGMRLSATRSAPVRRRAGGVCSHAAGAAWGRERQFDFLQQLVADLGPMLGVILLVGLAWQLVVSTRAQPIPTTAS